MMHYTKVQFGKDLKERILNRENVIFIGRWIYSIYLDWPHADDSNFLNLLIHLSTMELGPEFSLTYERLEKIADDLIAGKDITL